MPASLLSQVWPTGCDTDAARQREQKPRPATDSMAPTQAKPFNYGPDMYQPASRVYGAFTK